MAPTRPMFADQTLWPKNNKALREPNTLTIPFATPTGVSPTSDFVQEWRSATLVLKALLTSALGQKSPLRQRQFARVNLPFNRDYSNDWEGLSAAI